MKKTTRKKKGTVFIFIVVLLVLWIFFRNNISVVSTTITNGIEKINFKLADVKKYFYQINLSMKTKRDNLRYIDEYIQENKERDNELQRSLMKNIELDSLRDENRRLRELLELKESSTNEYIVSDVIFIEGLNEIDNRERIFIDKGYNDGIELNFPVMHKGTLIGRISEVGPDYSEVMLLTDKMSRISVTLNDESNQVLRGNGNGTFSVFNYNDDINENMRFNIKTSGISDIFPRNLEIGTFVIQETNAYNENKELLFIPSYKLNDFQTVLIMKINRSEDDYLNKLFEQLEIDKEFQRNQESLD